MLYDAIHPAALKPVRDRLSDNWGYLYGAMYTYDQPTAGTRYRDAAGRATKPPGANPGRPKGCDRDFFHGLLVLALNREATVRFDFARHRRVLQLPADYVRLNEFPEWFTVDENTLYPLAGPGGEQVRLGSELIQGVREAGLCEIAAQPRT
jgi:hypothetical protein